MPTNDSCNVSFDEYVTATLSHFDNASEWAWENCSTIKAYDDFLAVANHVVRHFEVPPGASPDRLEKCMGTAWYLMLRYDDLLRRSPVVSKQLHDEYMRLYSDMRLVYGVTRQALGGEEGVWKRKTTWSRRSTVAGCFF